MVGLSELADSHWAVAKTFVQKFGLIVRRLREEAELSQEALADAAGLHRTHVSLIERGQRSARLETVEALAKALRVKPGDLMPTVRVGKRIKQPRSAT